MWKTNIENVENSIKCAKTCGKLYISGEYSVLTAGQSAIIKNVDIFMNSEIKFVESENNLKKESRAEKEYKIFSDMFDYWSSLEYDKNYYLIQETIKVVNEYLELNGIVPKPFELKILGKMEKNGKKYGIGSSGSVTVLVVKAMFELYSEFLKVGKNDENIVKDDKNIVKNSSRNVEFNENENVDLKDLIFKISSYVLLKLGDNGSMGDIACISYNSLIVYKSFDREKISEKIKNESLEKVLNMDWKYEIRELKAGIDCEFLVGWTKKPSISKDMINLVKTSINKEFLNNVENIVENLKNSIILGEKEKIKKYINENSKILEKLNKNIYSEELKKLVKATEKLDVCAKSSGSGGGDCGIAISFNHKDSLELIEKWKEADIELIFWDKL